MRLLRIEEVAARLALKPSTVRKLIFLKQLPCVRPTKRAVRVREEDIDALIRVGYRPTPAILGPTTQNGDPGRPSDAP